MNTILDPDDMVVPRSPEEFLAWVDQKSKLLNATKEARNYARSGSQIVKKFYDEILPLSMFVRHEYAALDDVYIQPNLSSDNYDALVSIGGSEGRQEVYTEITYAKDGYDLSLRMEVLDREGHVFLYGPINKSGKIRLPGRYVTVEPRAADHQDTLRNQFELIEQRLSGKSMKQYGRQHELVVAVDDYVALLQENDWPQLRKHVQSILPRYSLDFHRLVLVGMAGRLFISFDLGSSGAQESV